MSPQVSWDMTTYHFPLFRLLVRWWTEVCNSSFPNGYKYPGSRGVRLTPISLRIRAHIRVHMKLTSDMEATCCIYIAVKHMYVDTQTRTPTDVLADLIDN